MKCDKGSNKSFKILGVEGCIDCKIEFLGNPDNSIILCQECDYFIGLFPYNHLQSTGLDMAPGCNNNILLIIKIFYYNKIKFFLVGIDECRSCTEIDPYC